MKKILFTILLLAATINADAQVFSYTYGGNTLYYVRENNNTTARVTTDRNDTVSGNWHANRPTGALVIPDSVCYYSGGYSYWLPVTRISPYTFKNCAGITSVTIGSNVTRIGNSAFNECNNLQSVLLPENITSIGYGAFRNCNSLHKLIIPDNVTDLPHYVFAGCSSLDSLYIGCGLNSMGEGVFNGCTQLKYLFYNARNCSTPLFFQGTIDGSQCPFSNTTTNYFTTLVIGDSVRNIPSEAFLNRNTITSLVVPDNVISIGQNAFKNCSGITSLYVGCSNIGDGVFQGCSNINTLIISNSVNSIGNYAFQGCSNISALIIPNNVTSIGSNAFQGCSNINALVIPDSVISIGQAAFMDCASINSLIIGNGITSIGDNTFRGCSNINSIIIPNNVITIGQGAFMNCTGISNLIIGSGAISIGNNAFYECSNISSIVIPDNVQSIGQGAFMNCSSIDSLYIGKGVVSLGNNAFRGCQFVKYLYYNAINSSTELSVGSANSPFNINDTSHFSTIVVGDSVQIIPDYLFYNCIGTDSLYLGVSIRSIGDHSFFNCNRLHQLLIPENTISIGTSAFQNCISIPKIIIPDSVNIIKESSFLGCSGADSLYIGSSVDSICSGAFSGCSGLAHLFIPNNVNFMGSNAFENCSNLETINIGGGIRTINNGTFSGCSGLQVLSIPNTITTIGQSAFSNCTTLDSVYIGSGVTTIGAGAFLGCNNIRAILYNAKSCVTPLCYQSNPLVNTISSLTFGDSVQSIPNNAFYNCDNLQNISIIAQTIGNNTFANCDNLLSANIKVNNIGVNAFADCDRLVSVTLGDSTQTLGNGAFSGCFRLQNIGLGGVTTIGDSAFSGCVRLERPELPATLTTIGSRAFNNCNLLSGKLTFPATITSIGDYAYNGIGTITGIDMLGATPPTIYVNTFASVSNSTPVSVPCGAVLNYYTTNYWENFSTIVEAPPYKLTVGTNNETMGSAAVSQQPICSNHSAIIQATAETGFHFLQWNDGNGTNPRTVNMTQDSTFTAIFVPDNSQVSVVPNDPLRGTTSGSGTYGYNAPVTMTATAYDGYHFLKWNDGNTQNPRYMAAVRDTTFTAIFVSNVSIITVGNANPDWGNVSGSGVYYYMNLVSLTATPMYGYHFSRWNDGNTQNPRTITVMQDSSFTAYFAVNTYSIVGTSNSTAMGSVSGGGTYTYLHEMSLTATPAFGYHFVQWNDQNTDNPRTITVTRDSAFTAQFAANSYTITAEPNDPTMGSAYGSGTYNFNTTATLTAVAEYGYHFTQWSDGVTDNPRTVTVQNSATYTAQFEINSYILTVQSSNPAIGTTSGGGSYNYLTPVNITANPNAGYHFTQWSDGNTDNPRLVTVTQNATYTAQFAINSYAVGVTSSNTNMGGVSGSGTYNHNSTATLTATAYYGYHFVQWQDGNTENPRSVVVTDSAQFTAQFDYNSYLVTANSSNVTLGSATGGGSYNYLSQVALTAVAVPHYHFTMWNDSIEDNPRTITVTRDTLFTAHFAIDRHTIDVHTADAVMGTVSSSDTVDYNTAVWITATANYGYHFTQWNDGTTSNPRRVVVSQDTAFTASFAPNQYSATCAVNDNSRGSVASTGGNYNYLTSVTFTAIPNSDYHFLCWSNGSTENPITFTLTKDTVLTAILVGLTANVNDNTMGTVSHSKPSNLVEVVTATSNYGYHFVQWNDGITDNPRTMNLVGDTSVTAIFAVNNYYVALGVNDESLGSVVGEGEYPYLSTVTITAIAAEHSHFLQWSDGNTTNPRMLTVTSDTSLTAYFESDQQFLITVNANDTTRGSVEGSGNYYLGESAIITATANEHYYFAQWSDGNTSNPRVITVTGDMTYTAVFEPVMYTLTVAANDYSMGQVTGGGSYAYGTEVTIEARAFGGYHFTGWSDGVMEEQRVVTVTEDATYMALFEPNVGINEIDETSYNVYVSNGRIVVEGVESKRVQIFDITGRKHSHSEQLPTGVYLVRIDNIITKKVVVL